MTNPDVGRAIAIWHRRAGKDEIVLNATRENVFKRPGSYWHCFPVYKQARKAIWNGVNAHTGKRRIFEAFPPSIIRRMLDDEMFIEFTNGATWQLLGSDNYDSHVGAGAVQITYSEWALCNPAAWAYHSPMIRETNGKAAFITTPRGNNHAKSMFDKAQTQPHLWFSELLSIRDTHALTSEQLDEALEEYIDLYGLDLGRATFEQEYECFKPDALVACHDQVKPISDIRVGDSVITHTGRIRRVDNVMEKPYSGDMVKINSYGNRPIICTPEHPIYTCDPKTQTYHWKEAKDISAGDYLVTPKLYSTTPIISEDLAKVIAWYVCEGSVSGNNLTFAIGAHEPEYVDDLCEALGGIGREYSCKTTGSVTIVSVNSAELSDFLVGQCGSLAHNKRLPMSLLRGNEGVVWDTLFKGDGCIYSRRAGYRPTYAYTTVSEGLAQQVQMIGSTLGYSGTYSARENSNMIMGRKCDVRTSYCLQMRKSSRADANSAAKTRLAKNGALGKVRSVEVEHYTGTVHNISVSGDESYIVNGRAVHNCSWAGAMVGAYFGAEMSKAEREGRITTVPIDEKHPVHCVMDLGKTSNNPVWLFQAIGDQLRIVDFYRPESDDLDDWCVDLRDRGWSGTTYVPHDIMVTEWGSKKTRIERLRDRKMNPKRIARVSVADGLQAGRMAINAAVFDQEKCEHGIDGLKSYRREWDDELKVFRENPVKDWAEHIGSAWRYLGLAWREVPEVQPKKEPPKSEVLEVDALGRIKSNMTQREAIEAMIKRRQQARR